MGLIGSILGAGGAARQIGEAVGGAAEVFVGNRAERDAAGSRRLRGHPGQFTGEFVDTGRQPSTASSTG